MNGPISYPREVSPRVHPRRPRARSLTAVTVGAVVSGGACVVGLWFGVWFAGAELAFAAGWGATDLVVGLVATALVLAIEG